MMQEANNLVKIRKLLVDLLVQLSQSRFKTFIPTILLSLCFGVEGRETELQPKDQEGVITTLHLGQVSYAVGQTQNVIYCASW